MSTVARARHRYTYDEYVAYERDSGLKHEYTEHSNGNVPLVTGAELDLASLYDALPE